MQPALALAMSAEGVVLYQNTDDGWLILGRAHFSSQNMGTQMAVLRRIAQSHVDDRTLPSLLCVPEDQLLWRRFDADGVPGDAASVNSYIAEALVGVTPFEVKELRFDWRRSGAGLDTAVIAVETLVEAEKFATQHGFSPVGVVSFSETEDFPDTAFFGLSTAPVTATGQETIAAPQTGNIQTFPEAGQGDPDPAQAGLTPAQMAARLSTIDGENAPTDAPKTAAPPPHKGPLVAGLSIALVAGLAAAFYFLPDSQTTEPPIDTLGESTPAPSVEPEAVVNVAPLVPVDTQDARIMATPEAVEAMSALPAFDAPDPRSIHLFNPPEHPDFIRPGVVSVPSVDAFAIQDDQGSDALSPPNVLPPPPPKGIAFDVDENGLVRATADGSRAPGGYQVVLGSPPEAPSFRPLRNADTEGTTRLAQPDDPLLQLRPAPRPGDLAERWERAQFGGRTLAELRAMRPAPRPAEKAARAAALFAASKPQVKLASAQTTRPAPRPSGIANKAKAYQGRQTQAAIASAASTAAVLTQPKQAPAAALVPQTQSKTPNFSKNAPNTKPRKAPSNVAKRATDPNELNLSKVSLLGTFGKTGSMRALVRLPSGRVVNVSVGDRVDGGRVVAIGQSELRYVKSGRNQTLKMPKS